MRIRIANIYTIIFLFILLVGCGGKDASPNPWGTHSQALYGESSAVQLDEIISNGELIMVTISGPDTYYDYHGHGMGLHYLLCEQFCQNIGVSLRVDVCKDTAEMVRRVRDGEADIVAMPLTAQFEGMKPVGENASSKKWHWLVSEDNTTLADTLNHWLTASVLKKVDGEQSYWLSARSVTRHVYSPMLNRQKGVISTYDHLFQRYAPTAGWDWHLLAAQCYQESTFDPRAHSWAGACGLMQIMPSTADHLGLARSAMYDPEQNVAAAARYIAELSRTFSDVNDPAERIKFVLASYNGGSHHVRDAMALARKHGMSPYRWTDVSAFILRLQQPAFYNDPVVKSGYMRGSETANYVERIWQRWMAYREGKTPPKVSMPSSSPSLSAPVPAPHPSANRKEKYNL